MSHLKLKMARKKLAKILSRADDPAFLQMIWAVDALQSDRIAEAARYITYPEEAATTDITATYSLHKWDLESLSTQLFLIEKDQPHDGRFHMPGDRSYPSGCEN